MADKNSIFYDIDAKAIADKLKKGANVNDVIKFIQKRADCVAKYEVADGKTCFVKDVDIKTGVSSIASSRLYEKTGILTPPVSFIAKKDSYSIQTIQPNVEDIDGLKTILANSDLEYKKISTRAFGKFKWQMFYDESLVDALLKFMTPSCLTSLQNMFLVDELRTDGDKHLKNYFFYKSKHSDKYEGVIGIDLDLMQIYNYCGSKKEDFVNFLVYPYQTATPHQSYDNVCYKQRITDMRQLAQDDVLSKSNIDAIKSALEYDFPKEIKKACKDSKVGFCEKNDIVKPVERLWEYNRDTIGRDLGM